MRRIITLFIMLMFSTVLAFAQNRVVTGTVTDQKGVAIEGASVKIKGSKSGTIADPNGNFKISVPQGATLIISGIGITTHEFTVGSQSRLDLNVTRNNTELTAVVVTALGISREKKALGYSVASISSDELTQGANPNLATALQGKVAGVEVRPSSGMPGASAQITIRGSRFFDGNNTPLYVIDGMPINSGSDFAVTGNGVTGADFSGRSIDIDPNDIASLSILKGQAASALYGTRASNGVIMITTQSGKGLVKGKPVVSFTTNYQFDQISRLPEIQQEFSHGSKGTYTNFGSFSWGPKISTLPDDVKFGGNVPNAFNNNAPSDDTKGRYWDPQKHAWVLPLAYNNAKDFYKTGLTAANNISVAQSGDLGNYYVGIGSTTQTGIMPHSGMDRYNARFSGDFNASSKIKVGISANYSSIDIKKMPSGNNSLLFEIYGAPPSYDMKGTPTHEKDNPYKQLSYRGGSFDNPYWATENNTFDENTRRIFGNTYISYKPINELTIRYQVGVDQYTTEMEQIYELGSASTGGLTASASNSSSKVPVGGSITNGALVSRGFNSLLTANYTKNITTDWKLNVLLGNEINDEYSRSQSQSGSDFNIGGWHNMANTTTQLATESKFKSRTVGFYANAGLDWRNMVFLNLTGRNDIVSSMPSSNRSFFYPTASLSWMFSELEGLREKGFSGKFRASYAEVGAPGNFNERVYLQGGSGSGFLDDGISFPIGGAIGYRPNSTLYDPKLKPQNTKSIELGTDLSFFRGRIGIEYTYSKQNTVDQIFAIPLAGSTGFSQIVKNGGEMQSTVHEASLRLIPIKSANFQWDLVANFTKVNNKVASLAPGVENIFLGGFVDPQVRAAIGYTYPSIYGGTFLKNDKGQILIDDDQASATYGMPLSGGEGIIGSVTPKFILGVSNTFRYKFVQLSALVDWKNGGQMYSGANRLIDLYGTSKRTADRETAKLVYPGVKSSTITADGKGGEVNDIVLNSAGTFQDLYNVLGGISEANIYKTSFVKLREVALSFDLPKSITQKIGFIRSASFSISARNILLWTELPNFDPESSQGNGNMQGGFDYMSLPQVKSIGVGLNLTF
jgi:TonB-linked SusC/RagA family outer membrane protein